MAKVIAIVNQKEGVGKSTTYIENISNHIMAGSPVRTEFRQ